MKRITAFFMTVLMILGCFPLGVFADYQRANTNFSITDVSTKGRYDLQFRWTRPRDGSDTGNPYIQHEPGGKKTYYSFFMRNASAAQPYGNSYILDIPGTTEVEGASMSLNFPAQFPGVSSFANGKIYVFKVQPYHYHFIPRNDGGSPDRVNALYEAGDNIDSEYAYLSNISISGIGSGNTLDLTWDNPKFDGEQIFTHYKIYYKPQTSLTENINENDMGISSAVISMNDPQVVFNADGTVSYGIIDSQLQLGKLYSVKVEPMISATKTLREHSNYRVILENGNEYDIAYPTMNAVEYRADSIPVKPSLDIEEQVDSIKISWPSLMASFRDENIDRILIQESPYEDFSNDVTTLGTITGTYAQTINYWIRPQKPNRKTYFRILIYHETGIDSNGNPLPMPSELGEFEPGQTYFAPYKPRIVGEPVQNPIDSLNYKITWEAFLREALNDEEKIDVDPTTGLYLDENLEYQVIITDSMDNFDDSNIYNYIPEDNHLTMDVLRSEAYEVRDENGGLVETKTVYNSTFSNYLVRNQNGGYTETPIKDNMLYYVQIVAIRTTSNEKSQAAYYSWYVAPSGGIITAPQVISKPPLRIKQIDSLPDVSDSHFTIQWDTRWFEVYDDESKSWYSAVGVNGEGKLVFGDEAQDLGSSQKLLLNDPSYYFNSDVVTSEIVANGKLRIYGDLENLSGIDMDELVFANPIRYMDIAGIDYAIHVVQFDTMMQANGYDDYYQRNLLPFEDKKFSEWQAPILPEGSEIHPEFRVTTQNKPTSGNLSENMAYIVYFLPFNTINGVDLSASYPSFLSVTTSTERPPLVVEPTVPRLELVSQTDTTMTVRWRYIDALQYSLAYSELMSDYSDKGTHLTDEQIMADGKLEQEDEDGITVRYLVYTIENLFPDTTHYAWVKAISVSDQGTVSSEWSNPVQGHTDKIKTPNKPQGLGLASEANVEIYNRENSTSFLPKDYEYLIIEWLRDHKDKSANTSGGATSLGKADELKSTSFLSTKMVKFNELIANKEYYIRVKTKLTVTKANATVSQFYTYTVQLARTDDFLDAVEVEVTSSAVTTNPSYTIEAESDWCEAIKVYTEPWDGEFDGNKNPDMYPLPTEDFEIIYDRLTQTLTYRFLSDGLGENLVDQRFITKLVNQKAYSFYIDLSRHGNNVITNRVVDLPYSIVKALDERKISLNVIANNLSVSLSPEWGKTPEMETITDFGVNSRIKITISENPAGVTAPTDASYVSKAQKLGLSVQTPTKTQALSYVSSPLGIALKLENRSAEIDKNVGAYIFANDQWQLNNSNYDNLSGRRTFSTTQLGSYSAIALNTPVVTGTDAISEAMQNFSRRIAVSDMGTFNPSQAVSSNQFNNFMVAVIIGKNSFQMNGYLSDADASSLSKVNMAVTGDVLTKEVALNSLVKLYEIKTKSAVKPYSTENNTNITDIQQASPEYRNSILKASELGFLGNSNQVNPKSQMTMGDLIYMLNIVLQDSGIA